MRKSLPLFAAFLLAGSLAGAEEHVVVRGDTLWALSGKYLGDPMRWPEIWKLNRETVPNPNLIFPNQRIRLDASVPPPAQSEPEPAPEPEPLAAQPEPEPEPPAPEPQPEEPAPAPEIKTAPGFQNMGILSEIGKKKVLRKKDGQTGKIVATRSAKILHEPGDGVSVRLGRADRAEAGLYTILRKVRPLLDEQGETDDEGETVLMETIGVLRVPPGGLRKADGDILAASSPIETGDTLLYWGPEKEGN